MGYYINKQTGQRISTTQFDGLVKNFNDANGPATTPKQQDALEQQYRAVLLKELSNRSGGLGLQDQKVNQAIHLMTLANQYKDAQGNYNIPTAQYAEFALGLANLISPSGTTAESDRRLILSDTAKGKLNKAIQFVTGTPQPGNTQALIKNLVDSVQRQGSVSQQLRDQGVQFLHGLAPTSLDQSRIDALEKNNLASFDKYNTDNAPSAKIQALQDQAAPYQQDAKRSLFSRTLQEIPGQLAKTVLGPPARVLASAVAAPRDIARGFMGKQPIQGNIPLVGEPTYQAQAGQDIAPVYDKALSGRNLNVGDYATALKPFAQVPFDAATSVAGGKVAGTAAQKTVDVGINAVKNNAEKRSLNFVNDLVTPTQTFTKTGTLAKDIKAGNVAENTALLGKRSVLPSSQQADVAAVVKDVPGIKPGITKLQASNLIQTEISNSAQTLRNALANQEVGPVADFRDIHKLLDSTRAELNQHPLIVGDAEKTAQRLLNTFTRNLPTGKELTGVDLLNARQAFDKEVELIKGSSVFDPKTENAVSIATRAIRQGVNNLIAKQNPDVAVKALLKRQTALYNALDNIAPKAAKEAQNLTGRLFQRHPKVGGLVKKGLEYGAAATIGTGVYRALSGLGKGGQ